MPAEARRTALFARDIMTEAPLAIGVGASLAQAITLMTRHKISGVPVIDIDDRPVGMLTEGDLLRRVETGTEDQKPGWLASIFWPGALAADYVQSHGRQVEELMTRDVICVNEDALLSEVVTLMRKHRVRRLPVVRDGRLVGIVSRADLVAQVGAALSTAPTALDDGAIRQAILATIDRQPWWSGRVTNVSVMDGVVQLDGCVDDNRTREAAQVLAENTPGVKQVENNLVCVEPQTGTLY